MKTIGLIGGMSFESTVTYYQVINETVRRELGGLHSAKIIVNSIDFESIARAQEEDDWDYCADVMVEAAKALEKAGAQILLIGANTMHICAERLEEEMDIPLLHIADATIRRLKEDGVKKTALLGTKYTLLRDFYKKRILDAGIGVLIPEKDIDAVNAIIYDELCAGIISEASKKKLLEIIAEMKEKGAEAVILGCTELDLLVKEEDSPLRVYDTTLIHGEEAALWSIRDE